MKISHRLISDSSKDLQCPLFIDPWLYFTFSQIIRSSDQLWQSLETLESNWISVHNQIFTFKSPTTAAIWEPFSLLHSSFCQLHFFCLALLLFIRETAPSFQHPSFSQHNWELLLWTASLWCFEWESHVLLKEPVINCNHLRSPEAVCLRYCTPSVLLSVSLLSPYCQFLEGSRILNRILWSMTTKQSCFISAANDLAPSNVLQLAKLKNNLPEKYTCTNRYAWTHPHRDTCNRQYKGSAPLLQGIHACPKQKCAFRFVLSCFQRPCKGGHFFLERNSLRTTFLLPMFAEIHVVK